ncbi:N-ethylammeline chlorohydrolase [Rhodoferax koreense]|uniref:N-ethylammeline chlorohydrolase n=1 Tax=Rhodoferax koreensis TaxID=1842727 RepID=A0A1P8K454_9BURK|nr:amidohydrolase family protein [Rhodoferax koreense]APW40778.1 N-ethylammeline chlorohydrolase [Rhodoferax koreense]
MRTLLKASCVVGFDGTSHVFWRNGEVVFSGDRIEFVGHNFPGHVDRTVDYGQAVICPGFIDLDALGDIDSGVLGVDNGSKFENGRLWSEDYIRRGPQDAYTPEEQLFKYRYAFTHLIRNGITTALPITSMYYRAWAEGYDEFTGVAALAGELGLRAYLGPAYMSGTTYARADRTAGQLWDEPRGLAGLDEALRFFKDFDGAHGGLVRGMFAPDRIETCTPELLVRTAAASRELDAPVRLHCCQSAYEFETVLRLRGTTPLGWLEGLGLLNTRAVLPHGIYLSGHPQVAEKGDADWQRLIACGASVAHCPEVFIRSGEALDSFGRYRAAGINLGLGTDTWPPDLLQNMRTGLYAARLLEKSAGQTSMADLFNAATLGGAKALRRDDLGRLAPGAQADIVVFDLTAPHLGPVFDPLKNLFLAGRGTDCRASYIAGRCVMEDLAVVGVDIPALQAQADRQFEKLLANQRARRFDDTQQQRLVRPVFPWAGEI